MPTIIESYKVILSIKEIAAVCKLFGLMDNEGKDILMTANEITGLPFHLDGSAIRDLAIMISKVDISNYKELGLDKDDYDHVINIGKYLSSIGITPWKGEE